MATKKKPEIDTTGGSIHEIDLYALGQAIDDTWGRSSTSSTVDAKTAVKVTLVSNRLKFMYLVVVNFNSIQQQRALKEHADAEADVLIKLRLASVKALYKKLSGKTLKVSEVSASDGDFEVINLSSYNANKTAYFRKVVVYEIT